MTATELLASQMSDVGKQIENGVKGMTDSLADHKPTDTGMSVREQFTHLAEVYQCVLTEQAGGKHEWGTFKPKSTEWKHLFAETQALRAKAVEQALAADNDDSIKRASGFIVGHDNYHVGQLVICRMDADSSWDAFSIYEGLH